MSHDLLVQMAYLPLSFIKLTPGVNLIKLFQVSFTSAAIVLVPVNNSYTCKLGYLIINSLCDHIKRVFLSEEKYPY